jgi:dTDP-4-amino-4,6-dideoxygalactose transaminase
MQFVDLAAQQNLIRDTIETNIQAVLSHGKYIMGPEIKEHGIACSSGTDALLLALMAYDVGSGDAIFTSPFTFIATAEVISLLGATPVFVDIEVETFNIDPKHLERAIAALQKGASDYPLPRKSGPPLKPKGIIAVDLFGLPADYDAINAIAKKQGLFVIEDAAQSFGAEYKGKKACSLADIACTSFFPAKPLGCYGDGGMCFTDDEELAQTMRSLCVHGQGDHKYENVRIGINGRLDTLQAAILHAKFDIFPKEIELRQEAATRYSKLFSDLGSGLVTPHVPEECHSVWAQYSVLSKDENHRSRLQSILKEEGIPTAIYYPKPLHLQAAFQSLGYKKGDFPVSEDYSKRIFSLPMHPYLTEKDQQQIVGVIG